VNFFPRSLFCAAAGAVWLLGGSLALATTTQTVGSGSAVSAADYAADFNAFTDTNLSNYTEDGLSVTTVGFDYYTFDPFGGAGDGSSFFYPAGATNGNWVTIETTDLAPIGGVEFLYGNGWTNGLFDSAGNYLFGLDTAVLYWQTLNGGVVDSSGSVVLDVGTVVGFSDPTGFDELQVSATRGPGATPGVNALALDNLVVQLAPPPAVADGGGCELTFALGAVLAGLALWHHRRPPFTPAAARGAELR
jgi:hypothetical protein